MSATAASGESMSLTRLTTKAPAALAASAETTRSGLRPDCEIARKRAPRSFRQGVEYTELTDGACEAVGVSARVSMRYFAKVAA